MSLISTIQKISRDGFTPEIRARYSSDELKLLARILDEVETTGRSATLDSLWKADFDSKPVDIDEFLTDDYYLGRVGCDVYDVWREDLRKVLSPLSVTCEWIIKGSIGSGKTFVAVIAVLYRIYYLSCLSNPQKFHGLAEGSPIIFGLFNVFKYLARDTSYQYLITFLRDLSPYFRSLRPIRKGKYKEETDKQILDLPKGIGIALGSTAVNALGQNIYGGLLDEAEFGRAGSVTHEQRSQIADLYHNVRTRMDSRFMQRGGINPGLLCLVSSARDTEQFLAKHVDLKRDDPHTHISSYALYDVKRDVYERSDRFHVAVGDKLTRSFILEDEGGEAPVGARVVAVPVEFLEAFRYDIDTALRDIAGVETYGKTLFLPRRDVLLQGIEESTPRSHPFTKEEITLSLRDDIGIEDYFLKDHMVEMFDRTSRIYRPIFYPYADRFVHVDLAKNRDCAGIAMSCISEQVSIVRFSKEGLPVNARDYRFFVDFMLRIRAARGTEIDFSKIRRFVFFLLATCNFRVKWVSYDSYQSTDSLQTFKKEPGVEAKEVSVDRSPGAYRTFRSIIMERRLDSYYYDPFFSEITTLEDYSIVGGHKPPIDHPPDGSKDVADSVCGSIAGALSYKKHFATGTEAEVLSGRAERYVEEYKRATAARQARSAVISSKHPLDKLFE